MATPTEASPPVERPVMLLLSLSFQTFFDETYDKLIDALTSSAQVKRVKTAQAATRYLEGSTPNAILITDEALASKKNRAVLDLVKHYVQEGGRVIVGLHFPNFTTMPRFDAFFAAMGLPWKHGDYHRTDFQFSSSCVLPEGVRAGSFPMPYSMKVLHVKDALPEQRIFVPVEEARTQSRVFPPAGVDRSQAAVVGAHVGRGYLVYVGDVNGERESDRVVVALCGL